MSKYFIVFLLILSNATLAQVSFEKVFSQDSVFIYASNELPIFLRLELRKDEMTRYIPLNEGDEHVLVMGKALSEVQDTALVMDDYKIQAKLGHPDAVHDDKTRYLLPYPAGKTYEVNQANGGSFSHNTPNSYYAFDFRMQRGDTISAARSGKVIWTEDIHDEGEPDMKYYNLANRIIIVHDDGSLASYLHLLKDGVFVEIGQNVMAGAPIGLSGNSGFSDGPHLHFMVQIDGVSKKIRFKNQPKTLKKGKFYKH